MAYKQQFFGKPCRHQIHACYDPLRSAGDNLQRKTTSDTNLSPMRCPSTHGHGQLFLLRSGRRSRRCASQGIARQGKTRTATVDDQQWRREVTRRLGEYRARTGRLLPGTERPLTNQDSPEVPSDTKPLRRSLQRPAIRSGQTERVDICIQPEFDFSVFPDDRSHPQTALIPVASLSQRRGAALLDGLFIGFTTGGFLALFHALGGQISFGKVDLALGLAVLYLFYGQYFLLFTVLGSATPGMLICGLSTVQLDGTPASTRQLLWRSFGYLLSGATLLIGFFWALWDEDHFTWQDRISHTYITSVVPFDATGRSAIS